MTASITDLSANDLSARIHARDAHDAEVAPERAPLQLAQREERALDLGAVGAYVAPVEYEADGTLRPGNLREAIRHAGPTFDLPVTFGI